MDGSPVSVKGSPVRSRFKKTRDKPVAGRYC